MDWLTFFSSLISTAAWPTVLGLALYWLRPHFKGLARRLEEMAFPGGHVRFSKGIDEVRAEVQTVRPHGVPSGAQVGSPIVSLSEDQPFLQLARDYPEAAVMEAYKELEQAFLEYPELDGGVALNKLEKLVNSLRAKGLIPDNWLDSYRRVRALRNSVVHAGASNRPTTGEAVEFRELCRLLAAQLRGAIEQDKRPVGPAAAPK